MSKYYSPPSHILILFLKNKWGHLDYQLRFGDSMKLFESPRPLANISVVDLAPVNSPIGTLVQHLAN